jgi:hypothetical membrane protein
MRAIAGPWEGIRCPEETSTSRPLKLAGALLFFAGAAIVMGIITAEALYPALYITIQEISDLGGTRPPDSIVLQPSAAIFDITMLVTGAMIIVATFLVHRAFRRRAVTISLGCYGAGDFLVGVFPGNTARHPYVAMFVFVAAGVAAVLASKVLTPPLRYISVALGTISRTSTVLGLFLLKWGPVAELGKGCIERWLVKPVVLWPTVFGGYLMGNRTIKAPSEAERLGSSATGQNGKVPVKAPAAMLG